jgi:integrase
MIDLPNGCSCSNITVYPKNWKTVSASVKKDWRIQFYFYDLRNPDPTKRKKYCPIKAGVNCLKTAAERRDYIITLKEDVMALLESGYNYILGKYVDIQQNEEENTELTLYMPFMTALKKAHQQMKDCPTKSDIGYSLNRIEKAAINLKYGRLTIGEIKRKHYRRILTECGKLKNAAGELLPWSPSTFNHYRSYLLILYNEIEQMAEIELDDPITRIKKQKEIRKYKETLSVAQRKKIDEYFAKHDYYFWRFIHIFFHSGSRICELLRLTVNDINIDAGTFKIMIRKGNVYHEDIRPIKDIALPLWIKVIQEAQAANKKYLFSTKFKPGDIAGKRPSVTQKWERNVKVKLGINIDLYSLKHLNLDETAEILDATAASKMAGHTSTVITMKHYLKNEKQRQLERLKKVNNSFS